ncbi:MAG: hypothetical protein ACRDWW_02330 [Acidimicrobiales bacterium]
MPAPSRQRTALEVVGALTVVSGAVQAAAPRLVLDRLAHRPDALSSHLFATVGMFMTVSGGALLAALRLPAAGVGGPLAWCAAQKLGSSAAVALGVKRGVLSPLSLPVAAFDLASGLLAVSYRARVKG